MQKPGRRIVSKGKYAAALGNKAALSSFGVSLTLIGIMGLLCVCLITGVLLAHLAVDTFLLLGVFIGVVGSGSSTLVYIGVHSIKEARQIDPGLPLTRANTAHLPAPDSLVRASQEPPREQQAVLVRPAPPTQHTPREQLVRSSASEQAD